MGKGETISAFFSKIAQTRDQLATIGVAVEMMMTLYKQH
jgi:hypothetical protein